MSIPECDDFENRFEITALERCCCGITVHVGCFAGCWKKLAIGYALPSARRAPATLIFRELPNLLRALFHYQDPQLIELRLAVGAQNNLQADSQPSSVGDIGAGRLRTVTTLGLRDVVLGASYEVPDAPIPQRVPQSCAPKRLRHSGHMVNHLGYSAGLLLRYAAEHSEGQVPLTAKVDRLGPDAHEH
jgi:hypothetical protein